VRALFRAWAAAYGGLPREAWLVALLELVNRSGTMVLFFLTLYLTRRLGFSLEAAGRIMTAFGVGSMVGTYLGGRLCDRLGSFRVLKLTLAVSGLLYVALQVPRTPVTFAVVLFALAVVSQALHPASATATAEVCAPDQRAKGFALNRLATNLGFSIGPVMGGYLALVDYKWLFWVDGLTSLATAALAWVLLPGARSARVASVVDAAESDRRPWRSSGLLSLLPAAIGISLVLHQILSTFPLYLQAEYGFAETHLGRLIAVNTALIVLFEMPLMHRLRAAPPARVMAVGVLLLGLGFGLMPFSRGAAWAAFTVVVWSFGEILALPTLFTLVSSRAGSRQGEALGLLSLAFSIGTTVAPLLGMGLYARLGGDAVWHACTLAGVLLAVVCLRSESPAADQREVAENNGVGAPVAESMR
jgi:predicted MFS family arabinose efflux permease